MSDKKQEIRPEKPTIDPRFVYHVRRLNKKTNKVEMIPALTADGYIDYAHQMGLGDVKTEIVDITTIEEIDGSKTRWVTVLATIKLRDKTVTGLSCAGSRSVSEPGYEVAVAETRAIKRAIGVGCNITEKVINPSGTVPTRETVDMPIEEDVHDEKEIPAELIKKPGDISSANQFEVD